MTLGRLRRAQGFEHVIHGGHVGVRIGKRFDIVGCKMCLRATRRIEHTRHRAAQERTQNFPHESKAVALVRALLASATERQLQKFVAVVHHHIFRQWTALFIRDPARQQRCTNPHGQSDLIARNGRRGDIEQHRGFVAGRSGNGDGVSAEHGFGRKCRHHT